MPNNLIVTCGTSQVEEERLKLIETKFNVGRLAKEVGNSIKPVQSPLEDQHAFKNCENLPSFKELTKRLCDNTLWQHKDNPSKMWENMAGYVGKEDNLFGAEISTLIMMADQKLWEPAIDEIMLLSSETQECVYSTAVIAWVLINGAGVKGLQISKKIVPGLNDNPAEAYEVTWGLADQISEEIEIAEKAKLKNLFVITGGYKAVIPCLTIFSLVFGIEMCYLFEKSDKLQVLNEALFDASEEKSKQYWQESLKKLKKKSGGQLKNEWFRKALEKRFQMPHTSY